VEREHEREEQLKMVLNLWFQLEVEHLPLKDPGPHLEILERMDQIMPRWMEQRKSYPVEFVFC
jgi:hypothetical protein